ncbi:MAG: DUF4292 domain-containing protein [Chitinophagaceae bacterium]|nr:DUF4292 domain-containing protein [Chitinophagaceae bacterium]
MKRRLIYILMLGVFFGSTSCKTTRQINKVIAPKDSVVVKEVNRSAEDSIAVVKGTMSSLLQNHISFNTFNAKIKVEYQDNQGKQPDITAVVRIVRDSAIWISMTASILNIEVYRILVTRDSIILLNKQKKEVQYRSMDYLQEVTQIPFDYKTLEDLLVGNPVFLDTNVISYRKIDNRILMSVAGPFFKHLLTINTEGNLLLHSKLDDVDINRNRTADITYSDFENKNGVNFSTNREITVSEKNKLDIQLNFKQYEFNKELSVFFNVPKNYKRN